MSFKKFLKENFITEKEMTPELAVQGKAIAQQLNVIFDGWWKEIDNWQFTDPQTKSTFLADSPIEAKEKLAAMRKAFGDADREKIRQQIKDKFKTTDKVEMNQYYSMV